MRGSYCVEPCAVDRCMHGAYHCTNYAAAPIRSSSSTPGEEMNALDYAWLKQATYVVSPVTGGASCVDLVNGLCGTVYGGPHWNGNAVDIIGQKQAGWKWIANTPDNQPRLGDVVAWHANVPRLGIGQYGHTAVCLVASKNELCSVDQGWLPYHEVRTVMHSYLGVAGWQRKVAP